MKDFFDIRGYDSFVLEAHKLLIDTLSEFFSASEVRLHFKPTTELAYYDVDISKDPGRNVYHVDDNTVLLVCHAQLDGEFYYLGIKLIGNHLGELRKVFNLTAESITLSLNRCIYSQFRDSIAFMGDRIIVEIISRCVAPGYFNPAKITHLVDKFTSLRSTTFEGKHFSTGLIITQSFHEYRMKGDKGRDGTMITLNRPKGYLSRIDNRFWYLADGFRTFFATDLKSDIHAMFVYSASSNDHLANMLLSNTLKGGDALFRVEAGREVSIITSDGIEFINQENSWRYRDYELLKKRIVKEIGLDDEVYNSLLYYVLYCSKNDISSLIWVPKDMGKYQDDLKPTTINKLARTGFNIKDQSYSSLIKRILSSDGATVISTTGEIEAFGCMVETALAKPSGVKGTGETAAGLLAKNGVAIKVSQDGTIKVFLNGREKAIKF